MHIKKLICQFLLLAIIFSSLSGCNNGSSRAGSLATPRLNSTPASLGQQQGTSISELNQGDFQTGVFESKDIIAYNLPQLAKHIVSLSVKNGLQIWQTDARLTPATVSNSTELHKFLHEHQAELKSTPTPGGALIKPDNDQAIYYDQASQTLYWLAFNAQNTAEEWRFKLKTGSSPELVQKFNGELAVKDLQAIYFVDNGIDVLVEMSYLSRLTNSDGDSSDGLAHQLYPAYIKIPLELRKQSVNSMAEPLSNYLEVTTTYVDTNKPSDQVTTYIQENTNNQALIGEWSALPDKPGNSWWQKSLTYLIPTGLGLLAAIGTFKSFHAKYAQDKNYLIAKYIDAKILAIEKNSMAKFKYIERNFNDHTITFVLNKETLSQDEIDRITTEGFTYTNNQGEQTITYKHPEAELKLKLSEVVNKLSFLDKQLELADVETLDSTALNAELVKIKYGPTVNIDTLKSILSDTTLREGEFNTRLDIKSDIPPEATDFLLAFGEKNHLRILRSRTPPKHTAIFEDLPGQAIENLLQSISSDIKAIETLNNKGAFIRKGLTIITLVTGATAAGSYFATQAGIQKWWPLQEINCGGQVCDQVELMPGDPKNKVILASGLVKTIKYAFNGKIYQLLVYQDFRQTCQQIAANLPTNQMTTDGIYAELTSKDNKKLRLPISSRNGELCNSARPFNEFVNEVNPTNASL